MKKITVPAFVLFAFTFTLFAADDPAPAIKSYQIRNAKFRQLLRPENASNKDGARLVLYPAQPWKCMTWKAHPAGDATVQLQNIFTGKTLAGKTNAAETAVVQVPFGRDSARRPSWQLVKLTAGLYQIKDAASGEVLTAAASDDGAFVKLAPWQDKEEQKWELLETDPASLTM
jgi:hypothetical protein